MPSHLAGMSANALEALAKRAAQIAKDLRGREPSYRLALLNGVEDRSYNTVRWGCVPSYSGDALIVMDDGSRWKAIGHGPTGTAEWVSREGYIEFVPVEGEAP